MFCKFCGKEIEDGSRFCFYCGKSQNEELSTNPLPQQLTEAVQSNMQQPTTITPPPKKKTSSKILIATIITLVVVSLGALGYKVVYDITNYFYNKFDNAINVEKKKDSRKKEKKIDDTESVVTNHLSSEMIKLTSSEKTTLAALESGYGKIKWDTEYTLKDHPGFVISISTAPHYDLENGTVIVGITNITSDLSYITAEGSILDEDGRSLDSFLLHNTALAPGNTLLTMWQTFDYDIPVYDIAWDEFDIRSPIDEEGSCEYTWALTTTDPKWDEAVVVDITNTADADIVLDETYAVFIDKNGEIISTNFDYNYHEIAPGETYKASIPVFTPLNDFDKIDDIVIFVNPHIY